MITPTRARAELVREAVISVIEQDYAGDIDVIVVHDQEGRRPNSRRSNGPDAR